VADCAVCTKPVSDTGYVCHHCTATLANTLTDLAGLTDELATTVARLDRISRPGRSATTTSPARWTPPEPRPGTSLLVRRPGPDSALSPKPLPVNFDAAGHRDGVTATLRMWAIYIQTHRGINPPPLLGPPIGPVCPHGWCRRTDQTTSGPLTGHSSCDQIRAGQVDDEVAALAKFIAAHLGWLRVREAAVQAWSDLAATHQRAIRVVDRPPSTWYAGKCWEPQPPDPDGRCEYDLYVATGQAWARCKACGTRHEMARRKTVLLELARDRLATAAELGRFLGAYGSATGTDVARRIRNWITRERLESRGTVDGHRLYRVGEALDLLTPVPAGKRPA
jgi:hypothetical protein